MACARKRKQSRNRETSGIQSLIRVPVNYAAANLDSYRRSVSACAMNNWTKDTRLGYCSYCEQNCKLNMDLANKYNEEVAKKNKSINKIVDIIRENDGNGIGYCNIAKIITENCLCNECLTINAMEGQLDAFQFNKYTQRRKTLARRIKALRKRRNHEPR